MLRNMVTSLIEHERIVTTVPKAKELRRLADRMVTLAKDGSLHARRQALSVVRSRGAVAKLFEEIAPRFADRRGGYTRVVRIGPRRGDAAEMSVVEFAVESLGAGKGQRKRGAVAQPVQEESVVPQAVPTAEPGSEAPASEEAVEPETAVEEQEQQETAQEASAEGPVEDEGSSAEKEEASEEASDSDEDKGDSPEAEAPSSEEGPKKEEKIP